MGIINYKGLKKSGIVKAQDGTKATRADSIALLNNTIAYKNYLNTKRKDMYVKSTHSLPLDEVAESFKDAIINSRIYEGAIIDPEFGRHIKNDRPDLTMQLNQYRINKDKNQFYQRDNAFKVLDVDAPMHLYDIRIRPYRSVQLRATDNMTPALRGDVVNYDEYHPLQVTPFDMLTKSQKIERQRMFGVNPGEQNLLINPQKSPKNAILTETSTFIPRPSITPMQPKGLPKAEIPKPKSLRMPDRIEMDSTKHAAYNNLKVTHYTDGLGRYTAKLNLVTGNKSPEGKISYKTGGIIKYRNGTSNGQNTNHYVIQPGDTLSQLSKKFNISIDELASTNNIKDRNKIIQFQGMNIPVQYDKELTIDQIPQTHHPHRIINNFSPKYDYIVQGDKIYYKIKSGKTWADISNNNIAKKNLYSFLKQKYDLKGYSEEEKQIQDLLVKNNYTYPKTQTKSNTSILGPVKATSKQQPVHWSEGKGIQYSLLPNVNPSQLPQEPNTFTGVKSTIQAGQDYVANKIKDIIELGVNYIKRKKELVSDEQEPQTQFKPQNINVNSAYEIRQQQTVGDTIRLTKDQYYLPEIIDLTKVRLGARNRGDYTPIESDAAIATTFHGFSKKSDLQNQKFKESDSFIGIDNAGNFKFGNINDFAPEDVITKTFKNTVIDFIRDQNGNIVYDQRNKNNPNKRVPLMKVKNDKGQIVEGSLNVLTKKGKIDESTYGNITGGRVIMQAGNEIRLVSGSMKDIEREFLKLKKFYPEINFFTLDNGTFSKGLRTYNRQFSGQKLRSYDNSHQGGGNFLYLVKDGSKPNKYKETIYRTPNVRTEKDKSYKLGHPLINEQKAIVLHHTAFEDKNLSNVHNYFMKPGNNSAHVLIGYDGERRVYASPEQVTFHAGESKFQGRDNVNDFGIGIEFQGNTSHKPLTKEQIESAVEYLYPIILKTNIPIENIVSHAMISGQRKKEDINPRDYNNIVTALKEKIYRKKSFKEGGIIKYQNGSTKELTGPTIRGKQYPKGTIVTNDPNDPRLKAYQDSIRLYNSNKDIVRLFENYEKEKLAVFNEITSRRNVNYENNHDENLPFSRQPKAAIFNKTNREIDNYRLERYTKLDEKFMEDLERLPNNPNIEPSKKLPYKKNVYGLNLKYRTEKFINDNGDIESRFVREPEFKGTKDSYLMGYKKPVISVIFSDRESVIPQMQPKGMPNSPQLIPNPRIMPDVIYRDNNVPNAAYKNISVRHATDPLGRWAAYLDMTTGKNEGRISTSNPQGDHLIRYKK